MERPRAEVDLELSSLITAHLRNIRQSAAKLARNSRIGEESTINRDVVIAIELLVKAAAQLKRRATNDT